MAKVVMFVYAESVQQQVNNGNLQLQNQQLTNIIVDPKTFIKLNFVPSTYSFAVSIGLQEFDTTVDHQLTYRFYKPNGEVLIDANANYEGQERTPEDPVPDFLRGIIMSMDFRNVPFEVSGEYYSELVVDGKSLGRFPIYVWGNEQK